MKESAFSMETSQGNLETNFYDDGRKNYSQSRNALWGEALRDDTNNGCVGD